MPVRYREVSESYMTQLILIVSIANEAIKSFSVKYTVSFPRISAAHIRTTDRRAKRSYIRTSAKSCTIPTQRTNPRGMAYGVRKTYRLNSFDNIRLFSSNIEHKETTPLETEVTNIEITAKQRLPKTSKEIILYSKVYSMESLTAGLKKVKNFKSTGVDGINKINFTEKDLTKLHKDLKTQRYKPKANKRVAIPKPNNKGIRYLGIATTRDKIVQASIHLILEPILEQTFSEFSFGFRPKRGAHDVLSKIRNGWQNVT